MHAFDRLTARTMSAGLVDVARWEQFDHADGLPFQAMWYVVPPGESSPRDRHPEAELSLVIAGTAWVETRPGIVAVDAGSAFLLEANEAHTIHNPADEPLIVFSAYWLATGAMAVSHG
jgi:quercetin dioxygenase-like cupin family protein